MEQSFINLVSNVGAPLTMLAVVLIGIYLLGRMLIQQVLPSLGTFLDNYNKTLEKLASTIEKFDETLDRNNLILMKVCEQFDIDEESKKLIGIGGGKN